MRRVVRRPAPAGAAARYAAAAAPRGRTAWRQASYCVADLETTGLDPRRHEIVSFGAVAVEGGRVRLDSARHGLVRPARQVSLESMRVHELRAADLLDAPPLDEAIEELLDAMAGRILVVHTARVERGFLRPALRRRGVRLQEPIIDTEVLGRLWLLERDGDAPRRLPLGALARALGLPAHDPHDALGDALTTAQAFLAVVTHLDALHSQSVRSLARAGDRLGSWLVHPHHRR
jgi:DNA polymerase-3 subunit epsilon